MEKSFILKATRFWLNLTIFGPLWLKIWWTFCFHLRSFMKSEGQSRFDQSATATLSAFHVAAREGFAFGTLCSLPSVLGKHRRLLRRPAAQAETVAAEGEIKALPKWEAWKFYSSSILTRYPARSRKGRRGSTFIFRRWKLDASWCSQIILLQFSARLDIEPAKRETTISNLCWCMRVSAETLSTVHRIQCVALDARRNGCLEIEASEGSEGNKCSCCKEERWHGPYLCWMRRASARVLLFQKDADSTTFEAKMLRLCWPRIENKCSLSKAPAMKRQIFESPADFLWCDDCLWPNHSNTVPLSDSLHKTSKIIKCRNDGQGRGPSK